MLTLRCSLFHNSDSEEIFDLADLTPQCGRRGDALKFYLSWIYYGKQGYSDKIGRAFELAVKMQKMLGVSKYIRMLSTIPPPCLQVSLFSAFYRTSNLPGDIFVFAGANVSLDMLLLCS